MFQRGHFLEVQAKIVELMTKLDDYYSLIAGTILTPRDGPLPDRDEIEYLYFKLMYVKAKTARKTRQLKAADEICSYLIETVRDKLPKEVEPTLGAPAVTAGATTEEVTDEVEAPVVEPISSTCEPKTFWKFAVKAAHLKVVMLAGCMEYA